MNYKVWEKTVQSGKDRARFYEYSLGSAREGRGWYYRRQACSWKKGDRPSPYFID